MADPDYLNGVALVETPLDAGGVLGALLDLEQRFGRRREALNSPRTLDLDLIAHGRTVVSSPGLIVPHPRAHLRRFVMGPLSEVAPGWIHPLLARTVEDLARTAPIGADAAPLTPI
jgi:2-amino-4-hydroxy-6-hydroxymethyldihydropteridine diphosphokinase